MSECLELLGDIVAIYPVPRSQVSCEVPFSVFSSTVDASQLLLDNGSSMVPFSCRLLRRMRGLVLDTYYNNSDAWSMEDDATAKETAKRGLSGCVYNTKLTAHSYASLPALRDFVNDISEADSFDVFVVDNSSNVFIIRGNDTSSSISLSASLPLSNPHQVDIEAVSVSGLQYIDNLPDGFFD